jgi:hypothetical protein
LPKLPDIVNADDELHLWLTLFKAETEEDLAKIAVLGVPVMEQAIEAYRHVTATERFKELERLRSLARHNEASALRHAAEVEREKWQVVVADKDAELERMRSDAQRNEAVEREKWQVVVADKDALIAELQARLGEKK